MQSEETEKTKSGRKAFVIGGIIGSIIVIVSFLYFAIASQNKTSGLPVLRVNNQIIQIEFARSAQEKYHGLCCRDSLPEDHGMLFVHDQPGDYRFWMRDTRIPLDMYWISSQREIVHIEHSVQPDSYPQRFGAPVPAQYVLETNAGYAKQHGIEVGDTVSF